MISNGINAIVTAGDAAVYVFTTPSPPTGLSYSQLAIINEGSVAGFFSIDGGTTWARLPATSSVVIPISTNAPSLKVKRIASGTDLAGIWGWAN